MSSILSSFLNVGIIVLAFSGVISRLCCFRRPYPTYCLFAFVLFFCTLFLPFVRFPSCWFWLFVFLRSLVCVSCVLCFFVFFVCFLYCFPSIFPCLRSFLFAFF